jgi:hypothetical protein
MRWLGLAGWLFAAWLLALPLPAQRVSAGEAGTGPSPRPDPLRLAELKQILPLTTGLREDDHPSLCASGDRLWVAWVSYSEAEGTDRIFVREFDGARWLDPEEVSDGPGDYHKPAIAVLGAPPGAPAGPPSGPSSGAPSGRPSRAPSGPSTGVPSGANAGAPSGSGAVWVVWPAQVRGNWDLYGRERRAGRWGKVERLTTHTAPDLEPQLRAARDQLWLVWQSLRNGNSGIFYRVRERNGWGPEAAVTSARGNNWAPALEIDSQGGVHVAWDTYRAGNYDIYLRSFLAGAWGPETPVAAGPQLEARPALATDRAGRVWITWEVGPENWAGDSSNGGLRVKRTIGLACWKEGKLYPAPEAAAKLDSLWGESGAQAPTPAVGPDGGLWLFFRRPINQNLL